MNRVKNLTPKQIYEFAKGIRKITDKGSAKLKKPTITRELLEKNQDLLLKKKSLSSLVGASMILVENGEAPTLPEPLHNKMLAHRIFKSVHSGTEYRQKGETLKDYNKRRQAKYAERYFEVLDCYDKTGSVPKRICEWRKRRGKDEVVNKYRATFKANLVINELSEEELESLIQNPHYAFKYAKTKKQRLPKKIEDKLLNESPMEYEANRNRIKKRSGSTPAEWKYHMLETSRVLLDYCNKFGVGLPASVHNLILVKTMNGDQYNNAVIKEGFNWPEISWEERRKLYKEGSCCKYKRHISNYGKFVQYLPTLISKKKLNYDNKISDLLKKRMRKKDRIYLETFVNVQMLDASSPISSIFAKKIKSSDSSIVASKEEQAKALERLKKVV
jgi:hypothetical protein